MYKLENVSFKYNLSEKEILKNINVTVNKGDFITIFGKSGSGKSTLLRQLKPQISPEGEKKGKILFDSKNIEEVSDSELIKRIGFVFQDPEAQCVTDKVWHELAFGLESLGTDSNTIKLRIAEISDFFHISDWFYKDIAKLSGGQKQLVNLAAVMVMQPDVIILDEPTSQISPIMASEFLNILSKINKEYGTTIILSEHRLNEVFELSNKFIAMDNGKIIFEGTPKEVANNLYKTKHELIHLLPEAVKLSMNITGGKEIVSNITKCRSLVASKCMKKGRFDDKSFTQNIAELKNIWFKYGEQDILKDLSIDIKQGVVNTIIGQNGSGKTTLLQLIAGLLKQYRGKKKARFNKVCILPQNIKTLFSKNTIKEDLLEVCSDETSINDAVKLFNIGNLLLKHPFDLSGGEQQRVGLAKLLLCKPDLLLLDEPTKAMDEIFKETFRGIIENLKSRGITIVMVTHDIEFSAKVSDYISLMFNGEIITTNKTREFLSENIFYTTVANRVVRDIDNKVITIEEVITLCK